MNKKLPYEEALEQQLSNLPLPDQDASWQKMQELLDAEKKRRPFFFFSTDNGKSLLSLLVVLGSLVVMHYTRYENQTQVATTDRRQQTGYLSEAPAVHTPVTHGPAASATRAALKPQKPVEQPAAAGASAKIPSLPPSHPVAGSGPSSLKSPHPLAGKTGGFVSANSSSETTAGLKKNLPIRKKTVPELRTVPLYADEAAASQNIRYVVLGSGVQNHGEASGPALNRLADGPGAPQLSLSPTANDHKKGTGKIDLTAPSTSSWLVRAGVGVQQHIPVGGQKTNAFNLNGNRNLLSDYIPSLFLRLERDRRWYLQAEFSYGAPQLVNDFAYSRQTQSDSAFRTVTTSLQLKKIFYHEVPISFNYYIRPRWTAGAGATYSWFHGAVTEKETATRNLQTQTSTVAKQIVPIGHYTDSFLYRSHTYILLQTNYQWQNASAGLRFSKDVQPYIRYTQPDGSVTDRKNWSLELLLRLSLWKSQKF